MIAAAAEPGPAAVVEVLRPGRVAGLVVGRETETNQLLDLLAPATTVPAAAGRAVVVSAVAGMGGIGKTALAVHTALLAAGRGWFPGGVLLLDLRGYVPGRAPVQPQQVYASLLRELGLPAGQIPATPGEQAGVYHRVLDRLAAAGARVLLVLDNAAHPGQIQDLLPRRPEHRALVTTRDVLDLPDARRIFLDVLGEPGAAGLLGRLLRAGDPQDPRADAEPDAVLRLVGLCGRLPLAVRIVAAILTDEPALTVAELAGQLGDADTRLHAMAYGDRDVAAVIDFSYHRLAARAPEAAALLALLTVNPGPDLSTETAAALAGTSSVVAATQLRALRAASLLQHTPAGRWRLHDLLALYARRHLTPDAEGPATVRLLDCYSGNARAADAHLRALPGRPVPHRFAGRRDALAWFDAEHANLTAAVAHAHHTGHLHHTTSLAAHLRRYLEWRWFLDDGVTVATHAGTAAGTLADPRLQAAAWIDLGSALKEVRRFDEAITAHRQAGDLFRELGDRHGEARSWNNLGNALNAVRRFDEAIAAHQNDLTICRELGDRHSEGTAWNNLGNALGEVRRFDDALAAHRQAGDIFRELGDRGNEGEAWNNLGLALWDVRRFDEAIDAHRQARDIYREVGDHRGEGTAWNNLGNALREVRRFDEAIDAHQQARDIYRQLGDRHGEGTAWNNLGIALCEVQRFDDAIDAHQNNLTISRELGDRHGEGTASNNLGNALQQVRRFDDAIDAHNQARDLSRQLGDRHGEAQAWGNLANALQRVRRFDEAITAHRQARDIFRQLGDRHSEGRAWSNLANALQEVRRSGEAVRAYGEAVAAYQDAGDDESAVQVRQWLEGIDLGEAPG
ncbi:tetratricopeptide repeat protein [Amycolatopsis sp. lyj-346]|uniref:tetratricopeptide repeat protein n=1 Tax=Amycolatopsis sp. lyj-346 TaxID=2789289 RepID=UPI00397C840D